MKTTTADSINIFLMIVASIIAVYLPFDLLLVSYAFLGPAHYLTEIGWLKDRHFFTTGKLEIFVILVLALLSIIGTGTGIYPLLVCCAFVIPVVFKYTFVAWKRVVLSTAILTIAACLSYLKGFTLLFGIFLPTLAHVYLFTGAFMLVGALKSRSFVAVLSLVVFIICPSILLFCFHNVPVIISDWAKENYQLSFAFLNKNMGAAPDTRAIFHDQWNIGITRFISFAYTYHYLNWFSKVKVIQWAKMPKHRIALICTLWLLSAALYAINYRYGLRALFVLSFLHVVLEFPLNHSVFRQIISYLKKI